MGMTRRLKILISAYACSPYQGSEPGVGWGFVFELAKCHELWVIVEEEKFRTDIERYLADNPDLARYVHFHFLRKRRNRRLRKIWPPSYYWYYRRWHEEAMQLASGLHREVGFDLAHQLTMVGFREPGYLWKLDIPFVWGPIGGMGLFPWRFLPYVGLRGGLHYFGYNILNLWQMHFAGRPRLAARAAGAGLITATSENMRGAERYWGCSSTLMSEVGMPPQITREPHDLDQSGPLRIVWSGQHTPGKALNIGLLALAQLPNDIRWELHVLGLGERTLSWRRLSERLGLARQCHFHGRLPREEALSIMASGHLLLITSLRDLTSTVTVEALALGLPIVCLDHCGFADAVDDGCGIKVPVAGPEDAVRGLADAVQRLAHDEPLRLSLCRGALRRAQDYSWEKKAEILNRVYGTVLQGKAGPSS